MSKYTNKKLTVKRLTAWGIVALTGLLAFVGGMALEAKTDKFKNA